MTNKIEIIFFYLCTALCRRDVTGVRIIQKATSVPNGGTEVERVPLPLHADVAMESPISFHFSSM